MVQGLAVQDCHDKRFIMTHVWFYMKECNHGARAGLHHSRVVLTHFPTQNRLRYRGLGYFSNVISHPVIPLKV